MDGKKVLDVMNTGVIACPVDTPIPQVAQMMVKNQVSAVVIIDREGYLAGLISRTDLVVLYGYQNRWPHLQAEHAMNPKVSTISPDETTVKAAQIMTEQKFDRLVVIETTANGRAKPVGIISMTDIVEDMSLA